MLLLTYLGGGGDSGDASWFFMVVLVMVVMVMVLLGAFSPAASWCFIPSFSLYRRRSSTLPLDSHAREGLPSEYSSQAFGATIFDGAFVVYMIGLFCNATLPLFLLSRAGYIRVVLCV